MALFLINICKYDGCGITFPNLNDLIRHIECTHIDYDPKVVELKEKAHPACLPLSYVLRFISEDARQGGAFVATNATGVDLKRKLAIKHHSYSISSSNRSNTPTGSELDEDEMVASESEDSNDSWTTEEFSSEFIMRYGSRHSGSGISGAPGNEKPFACPVPGCKKRYKNVNGIKYHSKNGHKKDGKVRKGYKCHCGKSYKTAQGLKNHALVSHNSAAENVLSGQNNSGHAVNSGIHIQRSSSPSQSLGSLSPSSISNMSSSASSCQSVSNNTHNGANGLLQHLSGTSLSTAISSSANFITTATTNGGVILQQQSQQHFSINSISSSNNHLQHVTPAPTTGNCNLIRSTIGLVSIKANSNGAAAGVSTVVATKQTAAATNLLAASAAANKILKLATNAAAAAAANTGSHVDMSRHTADSVNHSIKGQSAKVQQAPQTTPTKITIPSLVNLGILTPASSPIKTTQALTFSQQQQSILNTNAPSTLSQPQRHQQQAQESSNSNGNVTSGSASGKSNVLNAEQTPPNPQLAATPPAPPQHNLPLTPVSPNTTQHKIVASTLSASSSSSSSSTPITVQHKKLNVGGVSKANGGIVSDSSNTSNASIAHCSSGPNSKTDEVVNVATSSSNDDISASVTPGHDET